MSSVFNTKSLERINEFFSRLKKGKFFDKQDFGDGHYLIVCGFSRKFSYAENIAVSDESRLRFFKGWSAF